MTPSRSPDQDFQLFSVPSFPTRLPESVKGGDVGSSKQAVQPHDVLLCKINPRINRVWTVRDFGTGALIASTEWIRFAAHPDIEPDFLRYFLMRDEVKDYLAANASGVGGSLMRVRPATVEPIEFPLPARAVQRRIVARINDLLTDLDNGESLLARARDDLGIWRKALLKAAVTGELTAEWRAANPAAETGADLLARILDERRARWLAEPCNQGKPYKLPPLPALDELPTTPSSWTTASLPQLGDFGRGKSKHRPRDDARLYGGPHPFVQTGVVSASRGRIEIFNQTYSDFGLAQSKLWPKETLCITIAANIAKTGVLAFDACFPDSVVGLSCAGSVSSEYVEIVIRSLQAGLEDNAPATAQKNINLEMLTVLPIPLPPYEEQLAIVSMYREAEASSENLASPELNTSVSALRQSILSAAFRGDLVA